MIANVQSLHSSAYCSHYCSHKSLLISLFPSLHRLLLTKTNKSLLSIVVELQVWIQIRSTNSETKKHHWASSNNYYTYLRESQP